MLLRAVLIAALLPLTAVSARAEGERLTVVSASMGFRGVYKSGYWNPVWVTVRAGTSGAKGQLAIVSSDGDRVPVLFEGGGGTVIDLDESEETTVLLYAKAGPVRTPVVLQLRGPGNSVLWTADITSQLAAPLPPTDQLLVGIGPAAGLESAAQSIKEAGRTSTAIQLSAATSLPDQWWGYDGVDVVVLTTSDPAILQAMSPAQRRALVEWTRQKGRLVVCVGRHGKTISADPNWKFLLPGGFVEVSPLRQGDGLEILAGVELPFAEESFQRNRPMVTRLSAPRGRVVIDEGGAGGSDRPLAVRSPLGFGELTFVGLDLDHPSLAAWPGTARLLARLLAGRLDERSRHTETRKSVTHLGYTDLTGQLRIALDQFPGIAMVNFTTVAILTLVFLLLVGPGDYLVFSQFGWPRHWTWITFPLVAVLFFSIAWFVGAQSHGRRTRVNQAEVIDIDVESQQVRGMAWTHVFCPETRHFDLEAALMPPQGVADEPQGWLAWQGLPGDALGGLESRQIALASASPYRIHAPGDSPAVDDLPVQVAASKSLTTRWWSTTTLGSEARLQLGENGLLAGDFKQPLPVDLADCLLIHGDRLYRLGRLRAGQAIYIADLQPLDLEARLTEVQRSSGGEAKLEPTAWRQDSTDVPRIVQMLMFHDASRGASYTGLTHYYESWLDLTEQARLGRAMLVGRADQAVVVLQQDKEHLAEPEATQTWTWYRILMPVATPSLEVTPSPEATPPVGASP